MLIHPIAMANLHLMYCKRFSNSNNSTACTGTEEHYIFTLGVRCANHLHQALDGQRHVCWTGVTAEGTDNVKYICFSWRCWDMESICQTALW